MLDNFKRRMNSYGSYNGESRRNNSQSIMESTFLNDASTKPVYVKWVERGLPSIEESDSPLYAKFNAKSYHTITGDEIAYLLQFQKSDLEVNKNIRIGSYVCIPNEMNEMEWWLIVHFDDRPLFRQFSILKCLWTYRWVSKIDGHRVIHSCLGAPRKQNSYNSGVWLDYTTQTTENQDVMWLPTNEDTRTIIYDTRFLKSAPGYYPPIAWITTKIENAIPDGISKITLAQHFFDADKDNVELMIANYYDSAITPSESESTLKNSDGLKIVYSGLCAIRAGGGYKKFTAKNNSDGKLVDIPSGVSWDVKISNGNEDKFVYNVDESVLKIKCLPYYDLVGTTIVVSASGNGGSDSITIEVVGL